MTATPENIWQVPAYLPYVQPPLTDAAVSRAEEKIGSKLPTDYLNLLKKQNGGYIRFSLPDRVHDMIAGIGPHFPSLTDFDWEESQEYVSFPLKGLVPFDGDGHWHLCLDYRKHKTSPTVTYGDVECDRESAIAASFADYLANLEIDVGEDYVVEAAGAQIEQVIAGLSAALCIAFEPPEAFAPGYPTYRARLGTESNPQWLWLSPNTVPRGFVRTNDRRYAELKNLMPGCAQRFPAVPENACIFSVTDGVRAHVVHTCAQSRIVLRPLREYAQ